MSTSIYRFESDILNSLDDINLKDIHQAIKELESKINKTIFGKSYQEMVPILYVFKEQAERKEIAKEIHDLKVELRQRLLMNGYQGDVNVYVMNTWTSLLEQGNGNVFVRDGLKKAVKEVFS